MTKVMFRISMVMMEGFGMIALICGICGVKIF